MTTKKGKSNEAAFEFTQEMGADAIKNVTKLTGDMMTAGCRNVEALTATHLDQLKNLEASRKELASEQRKAFDEVGEALVSSTEAFWTEVMNFARTSTESNLATVQQLAESKDVTDWSSIQSAALANASSQFVRHAAAISEIATSASAKVYEPAKRMAEQGMQHAKVVG